jgi:hypothetical protein
MDLSAHLVHRTFADGSRFNPYILEWPITYYFRFGYEVGFPSSYAEIGDMLSEEGVLGIHRYRPDEGSEVELAIPSGAFVLCRVRRRDTGE